MQIRGKCFSLCLPCHAFGGRPRQADMPLLHLDAYLLSPLTASLFYGDLLGPAWLRKHRH
jgi:hypothetical protein